MTKVSASESEATALSVQPDSPKTPPNEFTVAEVREDGDVVLSLEDGRMFVAEAPEGTKVKAGDTVVIKAGDLDKHDVPKDAKIARVK